MTISATSFLDCWYRNALGKARIDYIVGEGDSTKRDSLAFIEMSWK